MIQKCLPLLAKLRARIGLPQIAALVLLAAFAAQCFWFMYKVRLTRAEGAYVEAGLLHIDRLLNAAGPERSALTAVLAAMPARLVGGEEHFITLNDYRVLVRLPFLFAGLMLGASLWYVARRLYGNLGGYIALGLYSFSPEVVTRAGQVNPEIWGAWGAFGVIFTAIAVAHTLYAPREVVLWNWRRILMLGLSIAICISAQFSLWVVPAIALAFMLWVGHVRRSAALVIFAAGCLIALLLLWAVYGFHTVGFGQALAGANWFEFSLRQFASPTVYALIGAFFLENGPAALLLFLVSIVTFFVWKRTRFFGTAAPLIVVALLLVLTVGMQHYAGSTFLFAALPFLILFSAGVSADLLESRYGVVANAVVFGVLIANALLGIDELIQLRG